MIVVAKRSAERIGQKERTRQALLNAARALVGEGETLTIARAADRAHLAEATAYRYYRNPRSLLRDALAIDWVGLDDLLVALSLFPSAADRAQRAAEEMARFVLAREASIRLLFASTDQEPREREAASGLPKASFRRRLVEAVLRGMEETLGADFRPIELALIVVISPNAVLTLRDAMPLDGAEISRELGRMARRLFDRTTA
jgi:hypothetical protein